MCVFFSSNHFHEIFREIDLNSTVLAQILSSIFWCKFQSHFVFDFWVSNRLFHYLLWSCGFLHYSNDSHVVVGVIMTGKTIYFKTKSIHLKKNLIIFLMFLRPLLFFLRYIVIFLCCSQKLKFLIIFYWYETEWCSSVLVPKRFLKLRSISYRKFLDPISFDADKLTNFTRSSST